MRTPRCFLVDEERLNADIVMIVTHFGASLGKLDEFGFWTKLGRGMGVGNE